MQLGAGHTSGNIVAWVPDAGVMFTGDLIGMLPGRRGAAVSNFDFPVLRKTGLKAL